jgi:hypothetical protein
MLLGERSGVPIFLREVDMHRMIKSETNDSIGFSRSEAIRRASFSAVVIFALAAELAQLIGMRFPPVQWAGIVAGVTILVWRRELLP